MVAVARLFVVLTMQKLVNLVKLQADGQRLAYLDITMQEAA